MRLLALSGRSIIGTEMTDSLPFHILQIMKSIYSWGLWKVPPGAPPSPRCSAQRNNLVQQETRERMVDILLSFILQKQKCKIYVNYIPYFLKKNSRPSINRLTSPAPLVISLPFMPSLSSVTGIWSSTETDQWRFKPWKLIKELNLKHLKNPCSVYLIWLFFDLMA